MKLDNEMSFDKASFYLPIEFVLSTMNNGDDLKMWNKN